jgi:hypothetical protein
METRVQFTSRHFYFLLGHPTGDTTLKKNMFWIFLNSILIFNCFSTPLFAKESPQRRPTQELKVLTTTSEYKPAFFFYSESTFLPKDANVVFANKLNYYFASYENLIRGYVGVEQGQDLLSDTLTIYNDNHVAPLIGAQVRAYSLPISFFAEYRQIFRPFNKPLIRLSSQPDIRTGAYGYRWWDLLSTTGSVQPFEEIYGEAVFSSMLDRNVFVQTWSKTGVRATLGSHLFTDGFIDVSLNKDRLDLPENNFRMSSLGARLGIRYNSILGQFLVRRNFELFNTFPSSQSRWNGQLVLSAEI